MSNSDRIKHLVEFWAIPAEQVTQNDAPHEVPCATEAEAVELERRFHAVGWAARVVSEEVWRDYPTAGRPVLKRAA